MQRAPAAWALKEEAVTSFEELPEPKLSDIEVCSTGKTTRDEPDPAITPEHDEQS